MYGPAATPPHPPSRPGPGAGGMVVRLLFASFPVWSLGLLAWVPSLRFAVIRGRRADWAVFCVAVALTVVYVVLLFVVGEEQSTASAFAGMYIVALIGGSVVHAVLGDRFLRDPASYRAAASAPYPAPHPAPPAGPRTAGTAGAPGAYGHPYPAPYAPPPSAAPAAYGYPQPAPSSPGPHPPGPGTPPPSGPQSPRMRQVASELDELDELLRRRDGGESR
ncbi:hypothetical protein GCM10010420_04520 [Streptomyces glaucosporus]|uniref:Integral membrane protein n=1 Tax=Streptomyces glaucosporus TaxID=284044 RepID=A0ABP5UPV0_9ACTN